VPKTAKNAAKIYFRLVQDGEQMSERFVKTKLMTFLTSITAKDIDETFNPFKMKGKWQKFFKVGLSKFSLDNDRVLKNKLSENVTNFINDEIHTFND
jgi:hypothetical protein